MGADEGNAESGGPNYGRMDQSIIWETATVDIPALLRFCEEQLADIESAHDTQK